MGNVDILLKISFTFVMLFIASPRIVDLKLVKHLNGIVSLSCVTTGIPQSIVNWIDLTPLPPSSFSVSNGKLQIQESYINSMKFLCNASNVYGWMAKNVEGNVLQKWIIAV
jgi:hypothetical protein